MVHVKTHRGEGIKERADDVADEGRREADEATAWTARTENLAGLLGCAEQDVAGSGEAVGRVRVAATRTGVDEA